MHAVVAATLALGLAGVAPPEVWLWAGVPGSAIPADSPTLYVYQGVAEQRPDGLRLLHRGLYPSAGDRRPVVPVVRLAGAVDPEACAGLLQALAGAWEARGRVVPMVQIDHDAPSRRVGEYADFLSAVRRELGPRHRLSVTGLADWLVSSPAQDLGRLGQAADEIVFQLYHQRHPVPGLPRYHAALSRFPAPFKVGLLAGMELPRSVTSAENYLGRVLFLQRTQEKPRAVSPSPR